MPYSSFGMSDIPPCMRKDKNIDYQTINGMIVQAFKKSKFVKTSKVEGLTKIYLETCKLDDVVELTTTETNKPLMYSVNKNTEYYSNYVELDRPLEKDEEIEIKYNVLPQQSDMLKNNTDKIYLNNTIYETLVDMLFQYAKAGMCI